MNLEKILNIILSIIFICYGILDCFGFFNDISFLENKSNTLMLISISIFLFTNLQERNIILKEIDRKTNEILDITKIFSMKETIEIVELNSTKKLFNYLSVALQESKSVCELTWRKTNSTLKTNAEKEAF